MREYKHYFQDLCRRVNYRSVVFWKESGEVLAFHDGEKKEFPKKCHINIQYDLIPKEKSKVFYGLNLTIDYKTIICSGSVNIIDIESRELVLVFFDPHINQFRDNQLPRVLWKSKQCVYLGHSDYIPFENCLKHSMVGFSDNELFKENLKDTFKSTDEAIFTKEVCFWDTFGSIRVNSFTSMIKYQKFPYYSLQNELIGLILVYTPINETTNFVSESKSFEQSEIDTIVKKALTDSNIFLAIQNYKYGKIEYVSDSFHRLGYETATFINGTLKLIDIIHPDDVKRYQNELNETLFDKKMIYKKHCRILTKTEEIVHAKLSFIPILDSFQEIASLVLIMEFYDFLERAEEKNEILLSLANKGHIIFTFRKIDSPFRFEFITGNISQFGYSEEDLLSGKIRYEDIIHHEDLHSVRSQMNYFIKENLNHIRLEYRIISRRRGLYWVEEKIYKTSIDSVVHLESTIRNITTSKRAIDELLRLNQNLDRFTYNSTHKHDLDLHFDHILNYIDLSTKIKELSQNISLDVAVFNNSDELVNSLMTSSKNAEELLHLLCGDENIQIKDLPKSPFENVFVKSIPLGNKSFRIGTIVVFGLVMDATKGKQYHNHNENLKSISIFQIDDIMNQLNSFASNVGYMIDTTALTMLQIQSSSNYKGDLLKTRNKHAILLEVLNIANHSETPEKCFDAVFAQIAEVFELSRGTFFIYNQEEDAFYCKQEWYSTYEKPHVLEYQKIIKNDTFFANWHLDEQNSFAIDYDDEIKDNYHFRDYAKAIIGVRVSIERKLYGILNFVDNHSMRIWSDDDIMLFEDIGYIFSYVAEKSLSHEQLRINQKQLEQTLDSLPNAVAIFSKTSEELLHSNKSFLKIFQKNNEVQTHAVNFLRTVMASEKNDFVSKEIYLIEVDRWFLIEKSPVDIGYGEDTCMLILTDITSNKKNAEMMSNLAFQDVLSGLPNRVKFEIEIEKMYKLSQANFVNAFIGILNIDNFKMINNTFSYAYGDSLIKVISKQLNSIPELSGNVYRFGGDEFAFIANNIYGEHVYEVANKVMKIFENPFHVEGYESYLTVSLGVGFFTDTNKDVNDLIRKANLSLMEAKISGKNKFVLYDISLQKFEEDTLSLERALKVAVENGCQEFEVYFQPIVNSKTGKIVSAEALVRWFSKELGFLPPVKFIPIAESTGLIIPLGKYILNQACKEARKWIDYGYDITISVNFSVIQTFQSDLISIILSALHTYRIPAKNLMVEITESLAIKDMNKVIDILNAIRQIGVKIAMDDFGTGYSSLSHLRKLPLDYVKIDRSFALNLEFDPYYFSFIETITKFCHLNNTKVCCEGVENENQRRILQDTSADSLQGYLFGHPMSSSDFWRKLIQNNE